MESFFEIMGLIFMLILLFGVLLTPLAFILGPLLVLYIFNASNLIIDDLSLLQLIGLSFVILLAALVFGGIGSMLTGND